MASILAPIAARAYKQGSVDGYGAVELDVETGEVVWSFDSVAAGFPVAELQETPQGVKHHGFRPSSVQRLDDGRTLIAGYSGSYGSTRMDGLPARKPTSEPGVPPRGGREPLRGRLSDWRGSFAT